VVKLRPIAAADVGRLAAFARGLSFGTRYFRFGHGEFRFSEVEIDRLCHPDLANCRHLIVVTEENGAEVVIASARFYILEDRQSCEMAIVVADAWQGSHLGHRLMAGLIESARECGLGRMYVQVLASNTRMLKFARRHGFAVTSATDRAQIRTLCLVLDETKHT